MRNIDNRDVLKKSTILSTRFGVTMKMIPTKTKKKPTDIALRIPSLRVCERCFKATQTTSLHSSFYLSKYILLLKDSLEILKSDAARWLIKGYTVTLQFRRFGFQIMSFTFARLRREDADMMVRALDTSYGARLTRFSLNDSDRHSRHLVAQCSEVSHQSVETLSD